MFDRLRRKLRFLVHISKDKEKQSESRETEAEEKITAVLDDNLEKIKDFLGAGTDIIEHRFVFGEHCDLEGAIVYIDGLVSSEMITQSILKPLLSSTKISAGTLLSPGALSDIKSGVLASGSVTESDKLDEILKGCLSGDTILFVDRLDHALVVSTRGYDKRGVSEPETEAVVRGPREGFIENLRTNTALLRRKIKSPKLRMDNLVIGEKTQTNICVAYIEDVANPKLIDTIKYRIGAIHTDSILDAGYIEQYIEDSPFSIFPTVGYTEKPDVAAAKLLEGHAAILVDGSPFALTAPYLFIEGFQSAEDYYSRTIYSSLVRILRYIAFFFSALLPAAFVALTTFHQEMIPTTLLFTISNAREGTPFPAVVEAFTMLVVFEILREAGLRLPRPVGQAVSIVGALVMGDAAVSAGLVGAPIVITVALTAVSGFVVPQLSEPAAVMRFAFLILGGALGGYGIALGLLALMIHLTSLKSFDVPYFSGLAPANASLLSDVFIRAPLWTMVKRPDGIAYRDIVRKTFMVPPARKEESDGNGSDGGGEAGTKNESGGPSAKKEGEEGKRE